MQKYAVNSYLEIPMYSIKGIVTKTDRDRILVKITGDPSKNSIWFKKEFLDEYAVQKPIPGLIRAFLLNKKKKVR